MKRNFSGTWRFNRIMSHLEIRPPDESTLQVKHRAAASELTRTHVVDGQAHTLTLALQADGRDALQQFPDLTLHSTLQWDDDVLVFDSVVTRGEHVGRNVVRYRLPIRDVLIAEEQYRSDETNYDNVWWFDRVIAPYARGRFAGV